MFDLDHYDYPNLHRPTPYTVDTWPDLDCGPFGHDVLVDTHGGWSFARCLTSNCGWRHDGIDRDHVTRVAADHGTVTVQATACCDGWGFVADLDCRLRFDHDRCHKPCPTCRPDATYPGCPHREES